MTNNDGRYEEFKVSGDALLTKVRELIHEGNVRRVFLKNDEGATILEIPLTAGLAVTVLTAAFSPALVAVGAIAALLTQVTVGVERPASAPASASAPAPTPEPEPGPDEPSAHTPTASEPGPGAGTSDPGAPDARTPEPGTSDPS